ncbi:MAG: hypothetical protein ACT4OE_03980 [Sphingosinicella sp.]
MLASIAAFIRDYQALVAGLLILLAALLFAIPLWRQLKRLRNQSDAMFREYLGQRLRESEGQRNAILPMLAKFRDEVGREIAWRSEMGQGPIEPAWAFGQEQQAATLSGRLEDFRATNRGSPDIESALAEVSMALQALRDGLAAIHRPASTVRGDGDVRITDVQWADMENRASTAQGEIGGTCAWFGSACEQAEQAFAAEESHLRDRLYETDRNLLG